MDGTEIAKDQRNAAPAAARVDDQLSGRSASSSTARPSPFCTSTAAARRWSPGTGETRASALVTGMDQLKRMARGELNLVVASLRGSLSLRGDVAFAVRALRAIQGGMPVQGADRGWARQGG